MFATLDRRHFRSVIVTVLLLALPMSAAFAALPKAVGSEPMPSLAPMLEHVTPAVVNIASKTHVRVRDPYFDDPVFRQFFGLPAAPRERVEQALGSGVIVNAAKGYILTNNHVIQGADEITVTLADGRNVKGTVIGTDPATDIAVLKVHADNLQALPITDSSKLRVGDFVVAVGDPFGLGKTVTSGIVSALERKGLRRGYQNYIQTDASINPGNSGGALVNLRGELVGINSMIYSPSGGNVGIGFAIPSDLAINVMHQLVRFGAVKRGTLGIEAQDITARMAKTLGMANDDGAIVTHVASHSAAAAAGVQAGDVITSINDQPLQNAADLHNAEGLLNVGSAVKLGVLRNGKPLQVNTHIAKDVINTSSGEAIDPRLSGASLSDLKPDQGSNGLYGIKVSRVADNSRADASGLRAGDLIIAVAQRKTVNLKALRNVLAHHPQQLLLTVVRGQQAFYILMR